MKLLSRGSQRLIGYDYSEPGAYFVTICTSQRQLLFGSVRYGTMYANALGRAARGLWNDIPKHRPYVRLGSFVVMPNHVHGIVKIVLHDQNRRSPERDGKIHPCSLSA